MTHGHCQVTTDEDTVMIFGGDLQEKAYKLTVSSGKWTQLPSMAAKRVGPAGCGLINNGTAVLVAGGRGLNTVEILDLSVDPPKWTKGKVLHMVYVGPLLLYVY